MSYFDFVIDSFTSIFNWLGALDSEFSFISLVFSVFVIGLIVRFLLLPLLGGDSGSDSAKRRKK